MTDNTSSGWFEDADLLSGKAPKHVIASTRAQIQATKPLTAPMVVRTTKPDDIEIPSGWIKHGDGYRFEKTVREEHTADNFISTVLKGNITGNHATLVEWRYCKDTSEINELQEKAGILEARLMSYVPSDPEFVCVSQNLHEVLHNLRRAKSETKPHVENSVIFEQSFHDIGFADNQHQQWCTNCMTKMNQLTEEQYGETKETK